MFYSLGLIYYHNNFDRYSDVILLVINDDLNFHKIEYFLDLNDYTASFVFFNKFYILTQYLIFYKKLP
jgi:hypothetical protein